MNWRLAQLMQYLEPGAEELDYETMIPPMGTMIEVENVTYREDNPDRFRPLDHVEKFFGRDGELDAWYVYRIDEEDPSPIECLKFHIHERVVTIG